jgi:hypothetical protein
MLEARRERSQDRFGVSAADRSEKIDNTTSHDGVIHGGLQQVQSLNQ